MSDRGYTRDAADLYAEDDAMRESLRDASARIASLEAENARLREAFRALNKDNHNWTMRPCKTCQAITEAMGEPFGCNAETTYRADRARRALQSEEPKP